MFFTRSLLERVGTDGFCRWGLSKEPSNHSRVTSTEDLECAGAVQGRLPLSRTGVEGRDRRMLTVTPAKDRSEKGGHCPQEDQLGGCGHKPDGWREWAWRKHVDSRGFREAEAVGLGGWWPQGDGGGACRPDLLADPAAGLMGAAHWNSESRTGNRARMLRLVLKHPFLVADKLWTPDNALLFKRPMPRWRGMNVFFTFKASHSLSIGDRELAAIKPPAVGLFQTRTPKATNSPFPPPFLEKKIISSRYQSLVI